MKTAEVATAQRFVRAAQRFVRAAQPFVRAPHPFVALALPLVILALLSVPAGVADAAVPSHGVAGDALSKVWNFRVLLDGRPIGSHRFSLEGTIEQRTLLSEARFDVKVFGITVYQYRHQATERWRGDCLSALASTTDDDGTLSSVRSEEDGDSLRIATVAETNSAPGCLMTYAYWNPGMLTQTRLLNAQTGKVDAVHIARSGSGTLDVGTQKVEATRFRISGPAAPIDVWYSAQGEWLGLDSIVGGKRKLGYRLVP